jgi:hypothetical protein
MPQSSCQGLSSIQDQVLQVIGVSCVPLAGGRSGRDLLLGCNVPDQQQMRVVRGVHEAWRAAGLVAPQGHGTFTDGGHRGADAWERLYPAVVSGARPDAQQEQGCTGLICGSHCREHCMFNCCTHTFICVLRYHDGQSNVLLCPVA